MKINTFSTGALADQNLDTDGPLVVLPFTEPALAKRASELMASRAGTRGLIACIFDEKREGFIAIVNRVFAQSDAQWVGYVAQDAYPGRLWLLNALTTLDKSGAGLLGFNDGKWSGSLAGFGLVHRPWALQNYGGPLFNPGYQRHYADAELTLLALNDGKYVYNPDAVLIEVDWQKDSKLADDNDRARFLHRVSTGFDDRITNAALLGMFS